MADMYLYILCEGELDEMFYERLCERLTGKSFEILADFRVRRGSNWRTAMTEARLLLNKVIKHWQGNQNVGVVIAVDNDRAPGHPGSTPPQRALPPNDLKKEPRYLNLHAMIREALGQDENGWPVKVALAVPVEMIESWVLTLIDPSRANSLPLFSLASQHSARLYHGGKAPLQLKDMRDAEAAKLGMTLDEFFWHAAEQDIAVGEQASPSLKMFCDELRRW
jgi:hypothetical protein